MHEFPDHLILPGKVYSLSFQRLKGGRAFDRMLVDFGVVGQNPLDEKDGWRTRLGATKELFDDYPSFKEAVPLEWLLVRFLMHHVRSNSVHILSGSGGEVLNTRNYRDFLGYNANDDEAEAVLTGILNSWIGTFPDKLVTLSEFFCSADITVECLRRVVNRVKSMGGIIEMETSKYKVDVKALRNLPQRTPVLSLDRKMNRYFQEIRIDAEEPFCFVIMPFRDDEFPQRIYFEIIKPFIRQSFGISCYRVDEDKIPDKIDNKIYTYLLHASFVVGEVTTLNPNVLYELGLAHMLEKDCIVLTNRSPEELPFDINRFSVIPYTTDEDLKGILKEVLLALGFKSID